MICVICGLIGVVCGLAQATAVGERPQHAGLAVGDAQFGARAGRGGVLGGSFDALGEDARRHECGDAQQDGNRQRQTTGKKPEH